MRVIVAIAMLAFAFWLAAMLAAPQAHAATKYGQWARQRQWSKSMVYTVVCGEAKALGQAGRTDMLLRWAEDIIWLGAHESRGNTKLRTRLYDGMWQYLRHSDWRLNAREWGLARKEGHGHARDQWRLCGVCSTRRWVRSMRDYRYNVAAIRRQWPTLGR